MTPLAPCPYCMSETMIRKINAWGVPHDECLDCGYVREVKRKPKEAA
jgi:Zn ribbon nucleic-acid-binding protein